MKFTKLPKYYLFIAIATFIAVMFVIIQQSYNKLMGPINIAKTSNLTKEIAPSLDTIVIDEIEVRKEYQNTDINSKTYVSPTPITSLAPTP